MTTREEYVQAIMEIAWSFAEKGGYELEKDLEMTKLCMEWNSEHPRDEIFIEDNVEDSEGRCCIAVEEDIIPIADWND